MAFQSALWNGSTFSIPGTIGDTNWSGTAKVDGLLMSLAANAVNLTLAQTVTTKTFTGCTIVGSSNTLSAIGYSSLTLTGSIVNADVSASAAISYSKLSLTGAILNADLAGSIAYGKLSLTGTILNADLAGSIAASKLVGSDIATVGTVTSGTWSATAIAETKGGTNQTTYTLGDLLYSSAANTLSKLTGNTTSTKKYLAQTGTGAVSAAPGWFQPAFSEISGQVAAGQMPGLTGDVTSTTGAVATTAAATQANITTLSRAAGVAVHGTNTNDSGGAGYMGEYLESVVASQSISSSAVWQDATSLTLTAGDWDVTYVAYIQSTATVGITLFQFGIGTTTGNSSAGLVYGSNTQAWKFASNAFYFGGSIPSYRISISGGTTYYAKIQATYADGAQTFWARLSARRVR